MVFLRSFLFSLNRYLNGDFEITQAPKGRHEGGRLSDGREAAPGELKRRQKSSIRKGKRDLEDPELLGRETEVWPALDSTLTAVGSVPVADAQSDGALRSGASGQDCPAVAEAGGHSMKSLQAQLMRSAGAEAGALQQEEKISAKPSNRAELESIKSQVAQCVAQMAGGRSVNVDLREVPQKIRRKMSKQKRDKEAVEDLVYTCNAAFLLAASLGKDRSRNKGAHTSSKMEAENLSHPDGGPYEWSGADQSNGNESSIVGSSPPEIAEALAAWLQKHDLGDSIDGWRVEACRGHLNFYAPADWLETKAGTADIRGETGKQASMSGKREVEAQAAGGAAAGDQPKRRKRFEMKMNRAKFDREVGGSGAPWEGPLSSLPYCLVSMILCFVVKGQARRLRKRALNRKRRSSSCLQGDGATFNRVFACLVAQRPHFVVTLFFYELIVDGEVVKCWRLSLIQFPTTLRRSRLVFSLDGNSCTVLSIHGEQSSKTWDLRNSPSIKENSSSKNWN